MLSLIRSLTSRLSRKKKGTTMKVAIQPGVTEVEVSGLLPGQTVSVTETNAAGVSPSASYTAPAPSAPPAEPTVTD
jgi:hypothetical protein